MHSAVEQKSEDKERKVNFGSPSTNPKVVDDNPSNCSMEQTTSPSSHGDCWKPEYLNGDFHKEHSKEFIQTTRIKKSQSLGSILDKERGSGGDVTDDDYEVDRQFSFNYSHKKNDSLDGNTSPELYNHENLGINFDDQQKENDFVEPFDMIADNVHRDSLFSIDVMKQFDGNRHVDVDEQSSDLVADSGCLSSDNQLVFLRSHSEINLREDTDKYTEGTMTDKMRLRSRSFGNLHSLDGELAEHHDVDEVLSPEVTHIRLRTASNSHNLLQESDEDRKDSPRQVDSAEEHLLSDTNGGLIEGQEVHGKYWTERFEGDNQIAIDRYQSHDHTLEKERREPETDDEKIKDFQPDSHIKNCDDLNPREFNIKRIEEWISQIDIESGSIVEEPGESSCSFSSQEPQVEVTIPPIKPDTRSNLGMEVAYNYISSLTATSSSAQMVNLGLVAVPFLSAFSSLRVLNLSGNSIVRITSGSLPRGLHMLNLSKNNIAIIEGLRDLTRLRVLDLSYNRIVRIGHGLASCSSLKELYLAGNKISEVEGLHRLLKLNILDLRGNKISTAKGLGQLAANYGSLQAINLEGNPAQRNVGDEQLKKYLLNLLPSLVYYNKHSIKASGTKEISDRPSRSASRSEHKLPRRGSHASGLHKSAPSHSRSSHAAGSSLKQYRSRNVESRHVRLPPMGSKPTNYPPPETEKKPVSVQPSNPIRRSRSEGSL